MVLRGLEYPIGSAEESLAERAIERRNSAQFLTTVAIVNAIIQVGNTISGAFTGSPDTTGGDQLRKSLDALRDVLLPKDEEELRKSAKKVKEILEREIKAGPLKVTPMTYGRKPGQVRIRRKDVR